MLGSRSLRALLCTCGIIATPGFAGIWTVDGAHSSVDFAVTHMTISKVKGQFSELAGTIEIDDADITRSKVDVAIPTKTVFTNEKDRDNHLRSPDFLNVEKFPKMTFVSTKITKDAPGKLSMTGNLTIAGITKEVTFAVEGPTDAVTDPWGNVRRGASASTKIDRQQFGITWNKTLDKGGLVVGNEIDIAINLEFMPADKTAAKDAKKADAKKK